MGAAASGEPIALPAPHDIAGLIARAKRDEWRAALAARLRPHCVEACAGAGVPPEEIEDVLGEYAASTLWGAFFEDLLAADLPGGRNIADDYLRRRGWKVSVATREYIAGLRRSVISLLGLQLRRGRTRGGRRLRVLCMVDEFTREALAIRVARKLASSDVIDTLADLFADCVPMRRFPGAHLHWGSAGDVPP
jgi:hypothetical protein